MTDEMYPTDTARCARRLRELHPEAEAAFQAFSKIVFEDGALSTKTKQLIAVAVAHVTQCPYCVKVSTNVAIRQGVSDEELMEAIWVAAETRAGAVYAHSAVALEEMEKAATAET